MHFCYACHKKKTINAKDENEMIVEIANYCAVKYGAKGTNDFILDDGTRWTSTHFLMYKAT